MGRDRAWTADGMQEYVNIGAIMPQVASITEASEEGATPMAAYGRALAFGINVDPSAAGRAEAQEVARRADAPGLDFIGIQDHPYQRRFLDTWVLMATLLAETERIHVFPNVANLPLRGAAMIAKQAASLDILSGGRFELALGAGTFWEAIGATGGPVRRPDARVSAGTRRALGRDADALRHRARPRHLHLLARGGAGPSARALCGGRGARGARGRRARPTAAAAAGG
jgi:alkanesulfonate monooxygenase SsuD/methylene tetrahydromethanopterin reductase-like flavin-dependent oxidoreductase (luciferase family)